MGKGADAGVCGFSLGRLGDWMRRVSKGGRASGAGVVGTRLGSGYGGGSLRGGGGEGLVGRVRGMWGGLIFCEKWRGGPFGRGWVGSMVGCWLHHLEDSEERMVLAEGCMLFGELKGLGLGGVEL